MPDSGAISIDGRRVAEDGCSLVQPEQRHIGMVFQDLALWPHMTVSQHLQFALRYDMRTKPADRSARIREVLEMGRRIDATPVTRALADNQPQGWLSRSQLGLCTVF